MNNFYKTYFQQFTNHWIRCMKIHQFTNSYLNRQEHCQWLPFYKTKFKYKFYDRLSGHIFCSKDLTMSSEHIKKIVKWISLLSRKDVVCCILENNSGLQIFLFTNGCNCLEVCLTLWATSFVSDNDLKFLWKFGKPERVQRWNVIENLSYFFRNMNSAEKKMKGKFC